MCKFFGIMLPYHPLIANIFTFYLRLDSHSFLLGPPLNYDLFEYMQTNRFQYGFILVNVDHIHVVIGLWNLFQKFLMHSCIPPSLAVKNTQVSTLTGWYSKMILFNNFEISNGSWWRSEPLVDAWLRLVDENGGIYRYRWGDAPVRTLAVTQFLEKNQVVKFRDIGYSHRRDYLCSVHTNPCQAPLQFQGNIDIAFTQGCRPIRNPLCRYYPEKA